MTKKRFIKLLMAYGVSRNEANRRAKKASGNLSHAELCVDVGWWLRAERTAYLCWELNMTVSELASMVKAIRSAFFL